MSIWFETQPKTRLGMKMGFSFLRFVLVLLALTAVAEAKQEKLYRVGVLMLNKPERPHVQALRDGLEKAGYIEGKNLLLNMEQRKNIDELRSAAKMFVQQKFHVIV